MRAIVCGGRDFTDRDYLFEKLDWFRQTMGLSEIIEGGQVKRTGGNKVGGADWLAKQWAQDRGLPWRTIRAEWSDINYPNAVVKVRADGTKYDAMAGPRRNSKMLRMGPHCCIAFPGGSGTADMIWQAEAAHVPVYRIRQNNY